MVDMCNMLSNALEVKYKYCSVSTVLKKL